MDLFIVSTEKGVSTCTHPFIESVVLDGSAGGVVSKKIKITEDEMSKVVNSNFINKYENGELIFEEVVRQPTKEEKLKEDLKTKLNAGTATLEDVKKALKLLL